MTIDIQSDTTPQLAPSGTARNLVAGLTLMLAGRAMTLAYITRAGGNQAGDPPIAWLMPLIGDAVIGVTALVVLALVLRGRGLAAWTAIVVWNAVAIWDALSAFIVQATTPWSGFFMVQIFGDSMFFAAAGMHALCLRLATRPTFRTTYLTSLAR